MNVYKDFRSVSKLNSYLFNSLSKRFDEPTYLSFRLKFGTDDAIFNSALNTASYDSMPHPLLIKRNDYISTEIRGNYAAIDYLWDANEVTRADMLKEFITKWNDLQENFSWYFQSIEGVADLLTINPKSGRRIPEDARVTIKCLEGLDMRITYLLNLYKKIAWDDTYQRWVLPDMMRYFSLDVFVAEFRTFHVPNIYDAFGTIDPNYKPYTDAAKQSDKAETSPSLVLKLMDNALPVWKIRCEMCEFDIESFNWGIINNLSVADDPTQQTIQFKIKVGNIKEIQTYPTFATMFLKDLKLNGPSRWADENHTLGSTDNYGMSTESMATSAEYKTNLAIAQTTPWEQSNHVSSRPFNERKNENNTNEARTETDRAEGTLPVNFNPSDPDTWTSNAVTIGTAFVSNAFKKVVDKAKITSIPGLGFSFNEAISAIESKNIITALGTIRKAFLTVEQGYVQPSQELDNVLVDNTFRSFLLSVVQSKATAKADIALQAAANTALNDQGVWEQIKDYSLATNLVAQGEINIEKKINGNEYNNIVAEQSKATTTNGNIQKVIIMEGIPSSAATTNTLK